MIQLIQYPEKITWQDLAKRPYQAKENIEKIVKDILLNVEENGDQALLNYAQALDKVVLENIRVSEQFVWLMKTSKYFIVSKPINPKK